MVVFLKLPWMLTSKFQANPTKSGCSPYAFLAPTMRS